MRIIVRFLYAGVTELVDVTDSKSVDGDIVRVRVPPSAPPTPGEEFYKQVYFIVCRRSSMVEHLPSAPRTLPSREALGAQAGHAGPIPVTGSNVWHHALKRYIENGPSAAGGANTAAAKI